MAPKPATQQNEPDGLSALVSSLDPRWELKASLESSRTSLLNRSGVLTMQRDALQMELDANQSALNIVDNAIMELVESLENVQQITKAL